MQVGKQLLRGVLGSAGTRYEIPLYQRTYDWERVHFEKLWNDLYDLALARKSHPGLEHFLGTLVLDSGHKIPNDFTFLVVDGQQRLTTLTVLLAAMRDIYRERRSDTSDAAELEEDVLVHRHKPSYPDRLRLWPTQGDRDDFIGIIEGTPQFSTKSNLIAAYKYFRAELLRTVAETAEVSIDEVRSAVLDGLRFVSITAEAGDNVYSIFESLNNTGLKLTQGDLLRNFFFSRLGELAEQVYTSDWFPMQERLSRDDLAHLFWLDLTWRNTEAKKDDTFKKQVERVDHFDASALRDEVKRFSQLAILLEVIRQPSKEPDARVRRGLQRLADFGIESIDPLVLGLLRLRQERKTNSDEIADALHVLESFLVRRLIVRAPHNALSRILMRAYSSIEQADPAGSLLAYFSRDNKDFASDELVRKSVASVNFYRSGTNRQRKTFLSWLEDELAGNEPAGLDKATIEHILPQHLTPEWADELSGDLDGFASPEAVHETFVHTLANLTLSGYNSKMSDKPFWRKRELLIEKSNIELNKWIAAKSEWRRVEILERGEYLAELISRTWLAPLAVGDTLRHTVDPAQVTNLASQIPPGRWATYGDVAEALEATPSEVKQVLTQIVFDCAWRVMDANGRYDSFEKDSGIDFLEYKRLLQNEGVQFDASGAAMRTYRWNLENEAIEAGDRNSDGRGIPAGPLRDFLDVAASRLTPGVSASLRIYLTEWITHGGQVLVGVDPDDESVLQAVLSDSGDTGELVLEFELAANGGLWGRRRAEPAFTMIDTDFDWAILSPAGA